jgi:curved DNA-binding protein CbpA
MRYADEILRLSFEFEKLAARRMPLSEAYAILGVSPTMDEGEIKKIYRRLAIQNHPDRQPEDQREAANQKMVQLNLAWEAIQQKDEPGAGWGSPGPDPYREPYRGPRYEQERQERARRARRERRERQERARRDREEKARREGLHVTFDEASIAANIPANAEWMFVTSALRTHSKMARVVIGMDAQNVYAAGIYNAQPDYYMGIPEQYRITVRTISRKSQRGLEQKVRAAIKDAFRTVIGDEDIPLKNVRVQQRYNNSWKRGLMYDGIGPKIGIRKALEVMDILRPKQPRQQKAPPPPPPPPPSERPTPEEAPPRPDEQHEPEAVDAVPAKTDTINLSALFVKKQGET